MFSGWGRLRLGSKLLRDLVKLPYPWDLVLHQIFYYYPTLLINMGAYWIEPSKGNATFDFYVDWSVIINRIQHIPKLPVG